MIYLISFIRRSPGSGIRLTEEEDIALVRDREAIPDKIRQDLFCFVCRQPPFLLFFLSCFPVRLQHRLQMQLQMVFVEDGECEYIFGNGRGTQYSVGNGWGTQCTVGNGREMKGSVGNGRHRPIACRCRFFCWCRERTFIIFPIVDEKCVNFSNTHRTDECRVCHGSLQVSFPCYSFFQLLA